MNGVINFYKEVGITSFKAVDIIRKMFGGVKCGHLGTLDPMAEGVLPMCIGYATKFADYLSSVDKEYIGEFKLGIHTDSFDTTGEIIKECSDIKPSFDEVKSVVEGFQGQVDLVVPGFSAKKINGVRAYKLARAGAIEDAGSKLMQIDNCMLLSYEYPLGVIRVKCGKGTYIRSIISSIGGKLGCGAAMSGLIRSANGSFSLNNSYKLNDLEKLKEDGRLFEAVTSVTELLDWGKAVVKDEAVPGIANGVSPDKSMYLTLPIEAEGDNFFVMDTHGKLLAVALRHENSKNPLKMKMVLI